MARAEWGTKRVCPTTGKRFYDLNKEPIVSPYTGEIVILDAGKTGRMMVADKADREAKRSLIEDEDDVVLADEDVDIEDDAEDDVLEEDADDDVSLDDLADVADPDDE